MKAKALPLFILTLFVAGVTFADSINPPFSATCECAGVHAYRAGTDFLGKLMKESWSIDERFFSKWNFVYAGGETIIIDGVEAPIFVQRPGVIIAGNPAVALMGAGIWTYAIHLRLEKIVASQVNAYGFASSNSKGVKARVVNLDCDFVIHRPVQ